MQMPDQTQLAIMQAQIDALEKDKATWQEDKVEMQTRIDHLLAQLSLCADETRVQVLNEGKNPSNQSQMWVYRSNEVSKEPVVIYDYQPII
jgi:hypothetical protein